MLDAFNRLAHIEGMNPVLEVRKHWIGYIAILLAGAAGIALVWGGLGSLIDAGEVDPVLIFSLAAILIFAITAATVIQLIVYGLSYLRLTDRGVEVKNYYTLFYSKTEQAEWSDISRPVMKRDKGAIFAQIFDYGSIEFETSGGYQRVRISLIPDPEIWLETITQRADNATP